MKRKRVEQLLREYAHLRRPERLLSQRTAARLRTRLAPPASEGEGVGEEPAEAAEPVTAVVARARRSTRFRLMSAGAATAAAIILIVVLTTGRREAPLVPGLMVDGAYDKEALFRTTRGQPTSAGERGNLFYVGVKVSRPAYVRIIMLDDHGKLELLPLDRSGTIKRHVGANTETAFGGYEVDSTDDSGAVSRVQALLVLASVEPLSDSDIATWIEDRNEAAADRPSTVGSGLLFELRARFRCAADVVRL